MRNDDNDLNDDGYPLNEQNYGDIHDEWLDEEDEYWADPDLDPSDSGNYDPADTGDNSEISDRWGDEDTLIGLDYDGYNDPDNY